MTITLNSFPILFESFFNQLKIETKEKINAWRGHFISHIKIGLSYLQDPRFASGAVFVINFAFLEIAFRISKVVENLFPNNTKFQENFRYGFKLILATCLVTAGNVGFIKNTGITLHPLVVGTLAISSFIIKHQLEEYLKN